MQFVDWEEKDCIFPLFLQIMKKKNLIQILLMLHGKAEIRMKM